MPESYLRTGAGEPSGRSGMRGRPFLRSGKNKPMIISARIRFLLFRHAIVFFPRLVLQPLFAFYTRGQHVLRRDRRINERSCVFGGWCCFPFSLVNVQRPWWGVIVRARRKRRTLCYSAPTLEFHLDARLSTAAAEAAGVLHFETVTWRLLQLHAAYVRRMRNGGRRSKVINITGIFGHNHFSAPPPGAGNKSARAVWCTRKCLISNLPKNHFISFLNNRQCAEMKSTRFFFFIFLDASQQNPTIIKCISLSSCPTVTFPLPARLLLIFAHKIAFVKLVCEMKWRGRKKSLGDVCIELRERKNNLHGNTRRWKVAGIRGNKFVLCVRFLLICFFECAPAGNMQHDGDNKRRRRGA